MKLTYAMLKGACPEQKAIFKAEWPNGAEVTVANAKRAIEIGLELQWWEDRFSDEAKGDYQDAVSRAEEIYESETAEDWENYVRATSSSRAMVQEITSAAWEEFEQATTEALRIYKAARVRDEVAAFREYKLATYAPATARRAKVERATLAHGAAIAGPHAVFEAASAGARDAYNTAWAEAWVAAYLKTHKGDMGKS